MNEVLGLQERKLTNGSMNEALVKLYDELIEEKQNLITTLEGALESVESRPKTLQFNTPSS
jgi:site-specific DNA-adenine methylase